MTTLVAVKLCPFCGKAPKVDIEGVRIWGAGNVNDHAATYIKCENFCVGPMASGRSNWRGNDFSGQMQVWRTKEEASELATAEAVKRWNKRFFPIDYTRVKEFSDNNRLDYNQICAAVRFILEIPE